MFRINIFLVATFFVALCSPFGAPVLRASDAAFGKDVQTVLFLGDSNTFAGHYIALVEAHLRAGGNQSVPVIINLGLQSETASGLTESDHPFPRPNVHERLKRALEKTQPDVVFACYGVNDAIYAPLDENRFAAYREGISRLVEEVEAFGATCVLCTPPAFDPLPLRKKAKLAAAAAKSFSWKIIYEGYDDVMAAYAAWIRETYGDRIRVVDFHSAINQHMKSRRDSDPSYVMSGDGIHINHDGHRVLADAILTSLAKPIEPRPEKAFVDKVEARQKVLRDAWLSEVGHKRPGVKPGLPIDQAIEQAKKLEKGLR